VTRVSGALHAPQLALAEPAVRRLVWLNVVGGSAVLASYAWGFLAHPETAGALWGGIPEAVRPLYTLNMLLAAAGYFLFTPFVLFRLPPETTEIAGGFGYGIFHGLYALVLFPSAAWMPLTFLALETPDSAILWLVRLALALAAVGSLGLLAALLALVEPRAPRGRGLAVAGLVPFCLQTAVLDAVVWPAYFPG
jgi:hypothetical protein